MGIKPHRLFWWLLFGTLAWLSPPSLREGVAELKKSPTTFKTIRTDSVFEKTPGVGVTVDGTLIKDGNVGGNAPSVTDGVYTSRTISTSDGLTGGGDLSADRTLSVDSTVVRTTGAQTIGGTKTFSSTIGGDITGNAATVTGGVYTTGTQTIGGAKTFSSTIGGGITGNAATVTNGVYTTGTQSIGGAKEFTSTITGSITGSAASVPNLVYNTRSVGTTVGGGLTGGGNLSLDRYLAVDSTVVRTTGNNGMTGEQYHSNGGRYTGFKTINCTLTAVSSLQLCHGSTVPDIFNVVCSSLTPNDECILQQVRNGDWGVAPGVYIYVRGSGTCYCKIYHIG